MKRAYESWSPQDETVETLSQANVIIEDYMSRRYSLTLRQLYYQMVAKGLISNDQREYDRLGRIVSRGRNAGMIDWFAIEDRTRQRFGLQTWDNPREIIRSAINSYRIDKWEGQKYRPFVWVEKEALAGVIARACNDEGVQVDYVSCRGYMSQSTIWREARNIKNVAQDGQIPIVFHLADHDPSGIDMTRDNIDRLQMYSGLTFWEDPELWDFFGFKRIALNMDQVEEYNPPPNPAKVTDSRIESYVSEYGRLSWELDALDPDVLVDLVRDHIDEYRDKDEWDKKKKQEEREISELEEMLGEL